MKHSASSNPLDCKPPTPKHTKVNARQREKMSQLLLSRYATACPVVAPTMLFCPLIQIGARHNVQDALTQGNKRYRMATPKDLRTCVTLRREKKKNAQRA